MKYLINPNEKGKDTRAHRSPKDYFRSPSDARLDSNSQQGYAYTTLQNRNLCKRILNNVVCVIQV